MTGAGEPLDPVEMTVEELAEGLAAGNPVHVYLGEHISVCVTLGGVDLFVRYPLEGRALADLASGLPQKAVRLDLPPTERHLADRAEVETGEMYLLQRALEARAMLVGRPDPDDH